ncbi:MAG: LysR family transcriptional regulator [Gemmatimonadaceae bacterium]|nr:LysR family transcriptional regulator [Gemmatimonadaceae bacterium]
MNLRQLECFIAVAHHLSFTRAAAELGMAQPPLSQHIRRLEAEFGVALFLRTNRRVELTDVGRAFLPRARSLIHQAQIARSEIVEMAGVHRGHLRVGASGTLAAFLLPELIAEFRGRYPKITVQIAQRRSEDILRMVETGELDIGLLRMPVGETPLETTKLGSEPLIAALPPTHPDRNELRIPLRALKREPFVLSVRKHEPFYSVVSDLCVAAGFVPNVICAGAEYTTIFRLVGMGVGVSVTSELASNLAVTPSPVFVRLDEPEAIITTVMVAKPHRERPEAAQAFHALALKRQADQDRSGVAT